MKRSRFLFVILVIVGVMFINTDVSALSCKENERDSILNHFNINSTFNSSTNEVVVKVDNGSFIITHID